MGASRLALPVSLGGLATGILLADAGLLAPSQLPAVLGIGVAGLLLAAALRGVGGPAALLAVMALSLALGAWRGESGRLPVGAGTVSALVGTEWQVAGTLIDEPRPRAERLQLVIDQIAAERDGRASRVRGRILVWLPRTTDLGVGDRIRFTASLEEPRDFDGFAYREYLARQGIGAIARPFDAEVAGNEIGPVAAAAAGVRGWLLHGLNALVPEPEAALGAGILLGVRSGIAPEIGDAFATAGLTHVVAISGWNIAILAALVAGLTAPLTSRRGGRWMTPAVLVGSIGFYVVITGASPSVVRAALMAAAMLVARLGGSRAHAASALMLAALVMLAVAPSVLWDVGFQLSLLATAGLIWFGAAVEARLAAWPGIIREPVALTLAAQITTLPIILLNFERLSLVAPLANVLVVPLVPLSMATSAIAALTGALDAAFHVPIVGDLAAWFSGGSAWLTLRAMILTGSTAAALPFAAVDLAMPVWLALGWYPALAAAWLARRPTQSVEPVEPVPLGAAGAAVPLPGSGLPALARRLLRPRLLGAMLVLILVVVSLASLPDGRLHLTALDIGQGDAILIETASGATMLIDGGPDPDLTLRRLGEALPFHRRTIDVVLLTHPHEDHIAGLVEVLARYRVGLLLHAGIAFENSAYDRLLADAAALDIPVRLARAGQQVHLDAVTEVEVLYPTNADAGLPLPEGDINNGSVVALLRQGGFSTLLTGDAEAPIESLLEARGLLEPVDVLKTGHHGSDSSTTEALLAVTRPSVALISDGVDNEYGHPSSPTLRRLADVPGLTVLRTDLHGNLEVISDGVSFRVLTRVGALAARPVHAVASGALASTDDAARPRHRPRDPGLVPAARRHRRPLRGRSPRGGRSGAAGDRRRHPGRRAARRGGGAAARHRQARDPPLGRRTRAGGRGPPRAHGISGAGHAGRLAPDQRAARRRPLSDRLAVGARGGGGSPRGAGIRDDR